MKGENVLSQGQVITNILNHLHLHKTSVDYTALRFMLMKCMVWTQLELSNIYSVGDLPSLSMCVQTCFSSLVWVCATRTNSWLGPWVLQALTDHSATNGSNPFHSYLLPEASNAQSKLNKNKIILFTYKKNISTGLHSLKDGSKVNTRGLQILTRVVHLCVVYDLVNRSHFSY